MTPRGPESDSKPPAVRGGYDPARRRRSVRKGREGGCWVYIPAAELRKIGLDTRNEPPLYRVYGGPRRGVVLSFYPAPEAFSDEDDGSEVEQALRGWHLPEGEE